MSLRVFISSTSEDLGEERRRVIERLSSLGVEPVSMDDWGAEPKTLIQACFSRIRDCDLLIGLYGEHYGFVPHGHEQSITELEWHEATARGIDRLCYFADQPATEPRKIDKQPQALARFKATIEHSVTVERFRDAEDLLVKLPRDLRSWANETRGSALTRILEQLELEWAKPAKQLLFSGIYASPPAQYQNLAADPVPKPQAIKLLPDTFEQLVRKNAIMLLHGAPGTGKTLAVTMLADLLHQQSQYDPGALVPWLLRLVDWHDHHHCLKDWLQERLSIEGEASDINTVLDGSPPILLLLDGFDEIGVTRNNQSSFAAFFDALIAFRQHYPKTSVLITSRTAALHQTPTVFHGVIELAKLTEADREQYFDRAAPRLEGLRSALVRYPSIAEAASTLLDLNALSLVFADLDPKSELTRFLKTPASDIEPQQSLFDHLIARRLGQAHKSEESPDRDLLIGLRQLARRLRHSRAGSIYFESALQPIWLPTNRAVILYTLITRLMTGVAIGIAWSLMLGWPGAMIVGAAAGMGGGIVDAARLTWARHRKPASSLAGKIRYHTLRWAVLSVFVLPSVVAGFLLPDWDGSADGIIVTLTVLVLLGLRGWLTSDDIRVAEKPLEIMKQLVGLSSSSSLKDARVIVGVAPGVALVLICGLGLDNWPFGFVLGLPVAAFGFLLVAWKARTFDQAEDRNWRPIESAGDAATLGVIFGFITFLGIGLIDRSWVAQPGLTVTMVTFFAFGGIDLLQHYTIRWLTGVAGSMPDEAMLETAIDGALLYRFGRGRGFQHQAWRDHFADLDERDFEIIESAFEQYNVLLSGSERRASAS